MNNEELRVKCAATQSERRIITTHVKPPIPTRAYDWRAEYHDGDERGPFGWGSTEQLAIQDLHANHG